MPTIQQHRVFARWLRDIPDKRNRARIVARIDRLASGNKGDAKSVGGGVMELRCDFGPGFRVYFTRRGRDLIILLVGGDKATQQKDIETAKRIASELNQ